MGRDSMCTWTADMINGIKDKQEKCLKIGLIRTEEKTQLAICTQDETFVILMSQSQLLFTIIYE